MKIFMIILAVGFIIFVSVYLVRCHNEYYAEYYEAKEGLEKLQGIKILEMGGNPDLTYEDIWANIVLSTGDTVNFYGLSRDSFDSTDYIWLTSINEWDFHTTGCRTFINFKIGHPAQYFGDLKFKSVQDVILNIDTVKKIINSIATYPEFDTLVNMEGHAFYYQKYNKWQIPKSWELPDIKCSLHKY